MRGAFHGCGGRPEMLPPATSPGSAVQFGRYIDLSGQAPVMTGGERLIFDDPRCADWLIKVSRSRPGHEAGLKNRVFLRHSKWRFGALRSWYKEHEEYLALLWRTQRVPDFIAGFHGFCQTSEGPGMVVEKIRDARGQIAPAVASLRPERGERRLLLRLIDEFFDQLIEAQIVAKDLHPANVVIAGDFDRLVLVDGLGDGVLLKTKRYVRYFRARDMEKKRRAFRDFVNRRMGAQAARPLRPSIAGNCR